MITAVGRTNGRPMLMLGLSGENMTRLMADEPIVIDGKKLGCGNVVVVLVGGRTEDDIVRQLTAVGLINAGTVRHEQVPS